MKAVHTIQYNTLYRNIKEYKIIMTVSLAHDHQEQPTWQPLKLLFVYKLNYYIQYRSVTSEQNVHGTQSIVFAICLFIHTLSTPLNPAWDHSFNPHTYSHHSSAMFDSVNSHYLTTHGMLKESKGKVTKLSLGKKNSHPSFCWAKRPCFSGSQVLIESQWYFKS